MAIKIGDNFSYQGKKYLDDRQSFATLSELQSYKNVPSGFIAYCEENGKRYEFVNNEWIEFVMNGTSDVNVDLSDYAKKEYVDELIDTHTHDEYLTEHQDISNLATKQELMTKIDDVEVNTAETNETRTALDFFANGQRVKTVYFSGGGAGGGTGGNPYISTELPENVLVETDNNLEFSIDFYSPTAGKGTLKVFVNNKDSLTTAIDQGLTNITITPDKLSKGTNQMVVYVIDRAGVMSNSLTFYVRYGSTELTSDFDSSVAYDYGSTIRYYFTPTALDTSLPLTFYMKIDGVVQNGVSCTSDTRSYYTFSNNISAGAHHCECWVENSNGSKSNSDIFTLVVLDTNTLAVVSKTNSVTLEEGSQLSLDYRVYKKNETSFKVKIYINDSLISTGTCGTSTTYYKTTSLQKGMYIVKVEVWDITETYSDYVTWSVTVTQSTYNMLEAVNAGSLFKATAQNRTNGDNNREVLVGYDQDGIVINGTLHNFSFNNESGWVDDQLLITGNSYVEIPVKPLLNNARYGFTLDVEFSAKQIGADEAEVLTIWDEQESCGIKITQEQLILQSKSGNRCELYFTEDEDVSAIFVIDRVEKTAKIYLNGVMCSAFALSDYVIDEVSYLEDFTVDSNIYLGGKNKNGYSRIKNIRVYEIALTSAEILNNFMSNEKDKTAQIALVNFQKGDELPTVTVYCDFSGLGKDDKKYCDIIYNSPDPSKYGESFALMGKYSQLQYQGTSSMQYPIKNYRLNPKNADGKVAIKLPFCQPETRFTLKADFMSSGHWQNTGLTKWINNNLYNYDENDEKSMNPAKWWAIQNGKDPGDYRECIYGFPCRLILVNDGTSELNEGQQEPTPGNTKDMGVFNFNLDKDCQNSLGFTIADFPNAISMEVTANSDTSAGAFMSRNDLSDEEQLKYLKESFELRYPDEDDVSSSWGFLGMEIEDENGEKTFDRSYGLASLIDWVDNSSDEEFVSEFEEHFHKDYTLRYYLLVIILGMVDNLGKNMMLDSYDGKIWMPRFYDCDTICSYDNSGAIKFDVDIEMEQGYWNTSSSRLWTRVRDLFHDELIAKYNNMRQNGLSYESFMSVFYDEQIAKIPQKYYNLDADVKYIPYADEYLGKAHGDGYEHLKRWLKSRLIFTDTLFDYTPSYTNDMITFRANTTEPMTITIETYNPVYQHVSWYNGNMEKGKISRGNKFTFTGRAQAATDQEILVYGGSNIKRITGISSMNPDSMLIGNATKLVELDVSNSPLLTDINSNKANLTAHTYLTKLNISNCPNLGGSLRLNYSPLIQEINAMNTGITDLQLPSSIRNLKTLKVPGALTSLTLNDASSLETLEFDGFNNLQLVSMTNCNALRNVINFDLTKVPNVTLNNSYDVEEIYMSETTNLSLINMPNLQRLIYLPNSEYETFNLTSLRNSTNYTISAVNCPNLKTFITTSPQRISYKKDTLSHDIKPNIVFAANNLDISNTRITDIKFLCTTDIYQLKLPSTVNNFICDSTFDVDTNRISEATFDFIHHELIDAYLNPDNYFRYVDYISHDIVPSSSDGSLIFSMYAPTINSAEPRQGTWDLYGLKFEEFYTFGMNNNIIASGSQIIMSSRYSNYGISIQNATIEPTRYPTMLYPVLVNEDSPISGTIDYGYYVGNDLSYTMAYANKHEVDIDIPASVIINAKYTHNIDYESEYTYHHPNTVVVYTTFASGLIPTFNSAFRLYSVNEVNNGNGSYTVTITASINNDAPTSISFKNMTELYSVDYINDTKITSMIEMFANCTNLTTLDVSNWDTSKVTNMIYMFANCINLQTLDLSNFDTSKVTNMDAMFYNCPNLKTLDVSNFSTSKVTSMKNMFYNCFDLQIIDVSKWNTSNVNDMSNLFENCTNLQTLDVSNWDTSMVTDMNSMFYNCSSLQTLDVSNWDTSKVSYMKAMFQGCSNLTTLDVSKWDTSKVTVMNSMFNGCTNLTTLDLSKWDTSKVTVMNSMFNGCINLQTLDLSKWDISKVDNIQSMFYNCSKLQTLDVSNWDTSKVIYTSGIFDNCSKLTTLKWTNWLKSVSLSHTKLTKESLFGLIKELGDTTENTLTLNTTLSGYLKESDFVYADIKGWTITPGTIPSYIIIEASYDISSINDSTYTKCAVEITDSNINSRLDDVVKAYTSCDTLFLYSDDSLTAINSFISDIYNTVARTKIKNLYFMYNFNTSRVTNMNAMFMGSSDLTTLDVSNLDTSSVENMNAMFYGCSKVKTLDVSKWDTSKVTTMSNMFYNCASLQTLDVSKWDTSKVTVMNSMFRYCSIPTTLDVSNWDTSKVTTMYGMFASCTNLTTIDVSKWDTSSVTIMTGMFNGCAKLQTLDVSNWDVSLVDNMGDMFNSCSNLQTLDVSKWDTSKVTVMNSMFNGCTNLTTLDVSNWDTSLVTIMESMFSSCANLIALEFTNWNTSKVTNISNTFYGCSNLQTLDLSNWDTSSVKYMVAVFAHCSKLQTLDLSNWDTSEVVDTSNIFIDCPKLTSLKWTNWLKSVGLSSTRLTKESLIGLIEELGDVTEQTLSLNTTLSGYLKESDFVYADTKGWTITPGTITFSYATIKASDDISSVNDSTYTVCVVEITDSNKYSRLDDVVNAYTSCDTMFLYSDDSLVSLASFISDAANTVARLKIKNLYFMRNFNTSYVTSMGLMFQGCSNLQTLDVSNFDTSKVTNIDSTFGGCSNLQTLDVSNWDTSRVTNMAAVFAVCTSLTTLDISNWDTSRVNTMANMFYNCSSLQTLDVSNFDTSKVTSMYCMFYNCSKLQTLNVSNWDTSRVTNMNNMFNGCGNIQTLDVSNWDTSSVNNMGGMFYNCYNLTTLDVSNFDTSSVDNIGAMFSGCSSLQTLDVSNFDTSKVTSMFDMFAYCSRLQTLDVSNWDTSEVNSMTNMFYGCSSLQTLDVSNFDTSRVTNMANMFYTCSSLQTLDVSNFDTSKVTSMFDMFANCSNLQTLDVSNWDTSKVTNMSGIFYICSKLATLKWVNWLSSVSISSTAITRDVLYDLIDNLGTSDTTKTLTLGSRLISYLTDEQIQSASNKNWTLVG